MANLTFLASYADLASQHEEMMGTVSSLMENSISKFNMFNTAFLFVFVIAVIALIGAAILHLLTKRAELKTEEAKAEAAKVTANAELLEAHVKAAEQQNSLLVRRELEKLSDEEVVQLMKDIRKDTRKKVANSDYSNIIVDDAELDKEIDSLMKDYFDDDKDDDK